MGKYHRFSKLGTGLEYPSAIPIDPRNTIRFRMHPWPCDRGHGTPDMKASGVRVALSDSSGFNGYGYSLALFGFSTYV